MRYIFNRKRYILEQVKWLSNKQDEWDQQFNGIMMSFHDKINDLIEELKDKFNDKDDPDEVQKVYMEYFDSAFESLKEKVRLIEDDKYLTKLWNELVLDFSLWKETFANMSENLDNYNSIFKLGSELFGTITRYNTKKTSQEYFDILKGDLDDQRTNVIDFIDKFTEDIKLRMEDVDAEEIFSMSNLDEKETEEVALNAGDEIRYKMEDGEENIALISHNQEELIDDDHVRVISKKDGEQFEIDKKDLIEIIPKHKTKNQEVADKLKQIKNDPDKLDKLDDYLTKIQTTETNEGQQLELNDMFDEQDLKVSSNQTKTWLSNPIFKKKHISLIGSILRNVYKPLGFWKKHNFWGVMDLPWEGGWSVLNKINTNYSALSIMINEINRALTQGGSKIKPFNFSGKQVGTSEFYEEYERLMVFVDKNKTKIFSKVSEEGGSQVINKMVKLIRGTTRAGDNAEKLTVNILPQIFNSATNIKMPDGYGESADMLGGIDLTFDIGGIQKTVQVKKCTAVFLDKESEMYQIIGTSLSKHYEVDYISCVTRYYLYLFEYDAKRMERQMNGDLHINKELLVKSIKI